MNITLQKSLIFLLALLAFSCNSRREIQDVQKLSAADIRSLQKDQGIVRQIECVTAHSIVRIDDSDLGVSSEIVGTPVEGVAKMRFLTPLTEKDYLLTCDASSEISTKNAEAKIALLSAHLQKVKTTKQPPSENVDEDLDSFGGGSSRAANDDASESDSYDTKEESVNNGGRWQPKDIYERDFRNGSCFCRDIEVQKINRPVYCTQKFRFQLKTGSNAQQYCVGFHSQPVTKLSNKDLTNVMTKGFCKSRTKTWLATCKKQQEIFKESPYYKSSGFRPENCLITYQDSCSCETDPKPVRAIQGQRFYCTQNLEGEESVLDINSPNGQEIYEDGE